MDIPEVAGQIVSVLGPGDPVRVELSIEPITGGHDLAFLVREVGVDRPHRPAGPNGRLRENLDAVILGHPYDTGDVGRTHFDVVGNVGEELGGVADRGDSEQMTVEVLVPATSAASGDQREIQIGHDAGAGSTYLRDGIDCR